MPAVLLGHATPGVAARVEGFCHSVADMLEAWIQRSGNPNTPRTYRRVVMSFVEFLGIEWPECSHELVAATVPDVRGWRDELATAGQAPKTLNARLSAVSGFYRFMREGLLGEDAVPEDQVEAAGPVDIAQRHGPALVVMGRQALKMPVPSFR